MNTKTLLDLTGPAASWIWTTSLNASVLALLVFLTQKLLARWLTPRLRYALVLLVFLRLLLPVAPSSPLSLENLLRPAPSLNNGRTAIEAPVPLTGQAVSPRASNRSPTAAPGDTKDPSTARIHLTAAEWLSLGWAAGFLGLLILGCRRYWQWNRFLNQARVISDPPILELLNGARAALGVRRQVKLLAVPRLGSPAVFGGRHLCLLLPQDTLNQLSAEELRMVFLHEMAHIRRHDIGMNFLLIAMQYLHWFNPVIWLASHRIRAERELVCDSLVMERLPAADRMRYGKLLLKLLTGYSTEVPVVAGAIAVVGSKQEIKRRLIMIKNHKKDSRAAIFLTVLATLALGGATFTRAEPGSSSAGGQNWEYWNDGQKIGSFYAVAGTETETVAVGIDGRIATRDNATGKWTIQTFTGDPDFRAIVHGANQYVVVREKGSIMTSPDGLKWTEQHSPTQANLLGLFWDGHQYLAGGDNGTILSSPDGVTWTPRRSGTKISIYSFAFSGTGYVAVGNDGVCTSQDSITWAEPAKAPTWVPFTACVWTGHEFLAGGLGLDRNPTIYTSPDGQDWTLRDSTIKASLRAAAVIQGTVYVAGDSVIAKSVDGGTTWTNTFPETGPNKLFMGLATDGNHLIAAGFNHNVWAMPYR
jgi:beta-lactamase regulating signal transducer with metallopeptidase domain